MSKRRWLNAVLKEAAKENVVLPWMRGKRPQRAGIGKISRAARA